MQVQELALVDFRNYVSQELELAAGLNLVVGANAQGKTNLLEAIYVLSGLGSPRGDAALVRDGAERALLHAVVARGGRRFEIDLELRPGRGTRALLNKAAVPRTRLLGEVAVSVFFGPDELSLVKGSPEGRRRFLDDLVVKLRPARDGVRREFDRVMRQRNALLKSAPRGASGSVRDTLEVWNASFSKAAATLVSARLEALEGLVPYAQKRFEQIAGGGRLELAYASDWVPPDASGASDELETALASKLDALTAQEIERGISLAGPQRDDVTVRSARAGAGPLDVRTYASQGDQRTAALALKLGEFDLLAAVLDEDPVLLLDDVFSELDASRRAWLAELVEGHDQTLVSSAEPLGEGLVSPARTIVVSDGAAEVA